MFHNIPQELQALRQWVCWRSEIVDGRQTKVPYSIHNAKANITNPATWASFNEVLEAGPRLGMSGIGMVLTENDPYTGIDIDDKAEKPASEDELKVHAKILEAFPSFTEYSVGNRWTDESGRARGGYHIIIKGKVPGGCDRGHVGVYSTSRYLTFTGQVVRNAPILECQEMLDRLYREMLPPPIVELTDREGVMEDSEVVEMAMRAANADKFNDLCKGDWQSMGYESQSHADFALLAILAFYTPNNEQVRRLFRMSNLGKRDKAIQNDVYLNTTLSKIRANEPPPVDMDQLQANANNLLESLNVQAIQQTGSQSTQSSFQAAPNQDPCELNVSEFPIELPPGLIGELAQYFYQSSIRPVPEISLIAAIGAVAGVVGRSYNISGQGLAQYMILLARTGTGKEAVSSGISRLFHAVQPQVPMVTQFAGPAVFASGPALHRVLSEKPCFVSVLGEFGYTVQRLSNPRASSAEITLKQLILDAFGKSGYGQVLQPSVYSDREKNINPVASPNITILGESTPESFYDGLDQSHIASGFLSRFLILEYTGDRPEINEHFECAPPTWLKQKFADLVTVAVTTGNNNSFCQVQMDVEGKQVLDDFNRYVDSKIRGASDVLREIWNRAHLKALKLAGLVAVGCNPHRPVVTGPIATWAKKLVEHDARSLEKRFIAGDVGTGDSKQLNDVRRVVESYFKLKLPEAQKFGATEQMHANKLIPYQYIIKKSYNLSSFKNDRLGSTMALKRTLQTLIDSGSLKLIPPVILEKTYGYSGIAYGVGKHWS